MTKTSPLPGQATAQSEGSSRTLRSARWYQRDDMRGFAHRQRTQQMGLRREEFLGRPVIAIINTWSELSPCHIHLRDRAEAVKRGVLLAGGYPVELPALSVGEVMVKPTTMPFPAQLTRERASRAQGCSRLTMTRVSEAPFPAQLTRERASRAAHRAELPMGTSRADDAMELSPLRRIATVDALEAADRQAIESRA